MDNNPMEPEFKKNSPDPNEIPNKLENTGEEVFDDESLRLKLLELLDQTIEWLNEFAHENPESLVELDAYNLYILLRLLLPEGNESVKLIYEKINEDIIGIEGTNVSLAYFYEKRYLKVELEAKISLVTTKQEQIKTLVSDPLCPRFYVSLKAGDILTIIQNLRKQLESTSLSITELAELIVQLGKGKDTLLGEDDGKDNPLYKIRNGVQALLDRKTYHEDNQLLLGLLNSVREKGFGLLDLVNDFKYRSGRNFYFDNLNELNKEQLLSILRAEFQDDNAIARFIHDLIEIGWRGGFDTFIEKLKTEGILSEDITDRLSRNKSFLTIMQKVAMQFFNNTGANYDIPASHIRYARDVLKAFGFYDNYINNFYSNYIKQECIIRLEELKDFMRNDFKSIDEAYNFIEINYPYLKSIFEGPRIADTGFINLDGNSIKWDSTMVIDTIESMKRRLFPFFQDKLFDSPYLTDDMIHELKKTYALFIIKLINLSGVKYSWISSTLTNVIKNKRKRIALRYMNVSEEELSI